MQAATMLQSVAKDIRHNANKLNGIWRGVPQGLLFSLN